jgi:uncharacterized protein (DUF302 family)
MLKLKLTLMSIVLFSSLASASIGMVTYKSNHSVKQTTKNLLKVLKKKGMTVFTVIKHHKGAKKVGKKLRPTTLVIFGNPKVGTPLMQCHQQVAIDLPQKALIWEDEEGQVLFSYNDPRYIENRHQIKGCNKVLAKISKALSNFANAATK